MAKDVKKSSPAFAVGGSNKMASNNTSGPQKPGTSSQEGHSSAKYASGGDKHMAGHSGAGRAKPGDTANPMNGNTGGWARGGASGQMSPNRGSQRAQPGKTSAY